MLPCYARSGDRTFGDQRGERTCGSAAETGAVGIANSTVAEAQGVLPGKLFGGRNMSFARSAIGGRGACR